MIDNHQELLENRAVYDGPQSQEVLCPHCGEELIFGLRDNKHGFSLGLTTVLECLAVAEKQGYVPNLPDEWWILIGRRYTQIRKVHNALFYQEE